MIDPAVVHILRTVDQVEISCEEPRADTNQAQIMQLCQEGRFVTVLTRAVNCSEPPLWAPGDMLDAGPDRVALRGTA
jgi:hypothetical protein